MQGKTGRPVERHLFRSRKLGILEIFMVDHPLSITRIWRIKNHRVILPMLTCLLTGGLTLFHQVRWQCVMYPCTRRPTTKLMPMRKVALDSWWSLAKNITQFQSEQPLYLTQIPVLKLNEESSRIMKSSVPHHLFKLCSISEQFRSTWLNLLQVQRRFTSGKVVGENTSRRDSSIGLSFGVLRFRQSWDKRPSRDLAADHTHVPRVAGVKCMHLIMGQPRIDEKDRNTYQVTVPKCLV